MLFQVCTFVHVEKPNDEADVVVSARKGLHQGEPFLYADFKSPYIQTNFLS
jgi:hypothetical protein